MTLPVGRLNRTARSSTTSSGASGTASFGSGHWRRPRIAAASTGVGAFGRGGRPIGSTVSVIGGVSIFGLRTSSSALPTSVNASTTSTTAAAGGAMYHQAPRPVAPADCALLRSWPQDGAVGSPRPMNASVVSVNTAVANVSTDWATIRFTTLGRMWRRMIRPCPNR